VIDPGKLREAFMALSAEIPEPYELAGVTYHGPEAHQEWVAFLVNNEEGRAGGPEGWGDTPFAALSNLRSRLEGLR
jgi:hypothetical protein